ncbi:MAG: gliding motility-associated C-terminal domain-containing protein, partial [Saprospiraceae bacterium]
ASFQEPGLPLAMVCRTLSIGLCCSGIISAGDSCLENTIEFSVITGSTVNNIRWNFGDPASGLNNTATILNPTHVFSGADTYSVQAIVGADCGQDTITQNVRIVYCNCNVYVPNVFTPNGDGVNDEFQPIVRCTISEYEYTVYDRWGERVFRTRNLADRWDGRAGGSNCPSDVYVYVLQYRPADGPPKTLYGDVTLLR